MTSRAKAGCAAWLCAFAVACSDDSNEGTAGMSGAECLPQLELDCQPLYPPTFDEFYTRRIAPTCGAGGVLCHGAEGHRGNLTLADADGAYRALVGDGGEHARVIPGDPECSLLIKRLESNDLDFVMPVRNKLSAAERCAIRQWIANGAERR
jgi:hypothetical protein